MVTITDIHELVTVSLSDSLVLFDGEYYKQLDGVAMSFPLAPSLANVAQKLFL